MIKLIVEKVIDDIEEEIYRRYEEQGADKIDYSKYEIVIVHSPERIFNNVVEDVTDELYDRLKKRNFFNDFHDIDI